MNQPPKSITFILLMAFFIAILVIIFDRFIGYIQQRYAARRPRMENWGFSTNSWLGSVYHKRRTDQSPVIQAMAVKNGNGHHTDDEETPEDMPNEYDYPNDAVKEKSRAIGSHESDFIARELFNNFLSPREECARLMSRVEKFLAGKANQSTYSMTEMYPNEDGLSSDYLASMKAIRSELMVNYDGSMKPITMRQRLFYRDRQDLIERKIISARIGAQKISKKIMSMDVHDDSFKDVALMRKFILEQVSVFYRYPLQRKFEEIDGSPPGRVNFLVWLAAWFIVIGCLFFFQFWIFYWGYLYGAHVVGSWGTVYGIAAFQDIIICEIFKIFFLFILAVLSAKPQLQVIKRVINDRALSLAQDGAEFNDEVSAVQHFSPACRAARLSTLSGLPSSAILRCMTDADILRCKEHKHFSLGNVIFCTLLVAAAIAALSEALVEQILSILLTSTSLSFALLHSKLLAVSPIILIVLYVVLCGSVAYHFLVYAPSLKRARTLRATQQVTSRDFAAIKPKAAAETKTFILSTKRIRAWISLVFFQYAGYLNSFVSNEGMKRSKEQERLNNLVWSGMNKPFAQHGSITDEAGPLSQTHHRSQTQINKRLPPTTELLIPLAVLVMRQTGEAFREVPNAPQWIGTAPEKPFDEEEWMLPIVLATHQSGRLARIYTATVEITSDPMVALRRILDRHTVGAEAHKNGNECSLFEHLDVSDIYLFTSEISELLDWSWETFYPGGKAITTELKTEITEQLFRWRKVKNHLSTSGDTVPHLESAGGAYFTEFATWFLSICDKIESATI